MNNLVKGGQGRSDEEVGELSKEACWLMTVFFAALIMWIVWITFSS